MKIRNGFVSNSSSSSFILDKRYMTPEQVEAIFNYAKDETMNVDGWSITPDEDFIRGYTMMDNGAINELFKEIDLRCRAIVTRESDG